MLSEPTVATPPAVGWISREDAKQFLRIDGDSLSAEVDLLIGAALAELEQATGQRLIDQEVLVFADTFADLDHLHVGPVKEISAISYQDPVGSTRTLDPAVYELFGAGIDRGIRLAIGAAWPRTRAARGAISVTLKVGYGPSAAKIPQQLRYALFSLLRGKFTNKPVSIDAQIANERINP